MQWTPTTMEFWVPNASLLMKGFKTMSALTSDDFWRAVKENSPEDIRSRKIQTLKSVNSSSFYLENILSFFFAFLIIVLVNSTIIVLLRVIPSHYISMRKMILFCLPFFVCLLDDLSNLLVVMIRRCGHCVWKWLRKIITFVDTSRCYFWNLWWCFFDPSKFFQILSDSFIL